MKRCLRQLFSLLTVLLLTGWGVRAQNINTVAGQTGILGPSGDGGPATAATLSTLNSMATDRIGNFYVVDNGGFTIRKVDTRGIITTVAGIGNNNSSTETGDGGPATAAQLGPIISMAADSIGDLFLFAQAGTAYGTTSIRRVDAKTGIITTVTSSRGTLPWADGTAAKDAMFTNIITNPLPVVADAKGNLYVANIDVSYTKIFKIGTDGVISTYMDFNGQADEQGMTFDVSTLSPDMVMDHDGTLYWADPNRGVVYKAGKDGIITKMAGVIYAYSYGGDGGSALDASFFVPYSVAVDDKGNVYVSDTYNYLIRKIDRSGTISTICGVLGDAGPSGDGGPAIDAKAGTAQVIRTDIDGNVLIMDPVDYVVRMIGAPVAKFSFDAIPSKTYGDADFLLNASASNGSVPAFSSDKPAVATVAADGTVHIVGAGTATLTAGFPAVGGDAAVTKTQTLTVAKAALTVTADDKTITFGDALPTLTLTYSGFVNSEDAGDLATAPAPATTANGDSPSGNYPITVSGGVSDNYAFTYVAGTLFIKQPVVKPQTITFGALADMTYGAADLDAGAVSDNTTIPVVLSSNNTAVATIVGGKVHIVGVGNVTIKASQAGDAFYSPAADVSQSFTVNKALLSVTADNKTVVYGSAPPTLTLSYSGFVNGEGVTVLTTAPQASVTANAGSPAGDYPISITPGAAVNYSFDYYPGVLTITASAQTITFNALTSKNYTDGDYPAGAVSTNTTIPITYTSSDVSVATIGTDGTIHIVGTGVTTITAAQAGNANYSAASVSQPLTVGPAPLIITPDDVSRVQGQANPTFTFHYSGFRQGEDPAVLTQLPTAVTPANADSYPGVYLVTASGADGGDHYTISYQTGALTVTLDSTKQHDLLETWCSSPTMLEVSVFATANQKATIGLYSLGGQQVVTVPVYLANATNSFHIPVANLAPGLYVVQVQGQYLKLSQKIRIQ